MARRLNVRSILGRYGLRPKRHWSQNFLVDVDVIAAIAEAACRSPLSAVVELGAGFGALTAMLARRTGRVVAVERDRDLAAVLRQEFAGDQAVEIVEANAATLDFGELTGPLGDRVAAVGNLPYHMAAPILFHLIASGEVFTHWVLMFQKEMADRLASGPGSREYGVISVLAQQHCEIESVLEVAPDSFYPAPKVRSRVLLFSPRESPRVEVRSPEMFKRVVKGAFSQRRKKLRNSLLAAFSTLDKAAIDQALIRAEVDGQVRAEQLSIEMFGRLADEFYGLVNGKTQ
jgi:16S rRNA (adenine1518-N6/adenine1519-N6)-dimethyltransferase